METRKIDDYRGFEVHVDETRWNFHVIGEDFTTEEQYGARSFGSLEAAKAAIDAHHTAEGKVAAKQVKVALPVFDDRGETMTITGLHRASGKAKVEGRRDDNKGVYEGKVYPPVNWVGDTLRRRDAIWKELTHLDAQLSKLAVNVGASYHRQIAAERYAGMIGKLSQELKEAQTKAEGVNEAQRMASMGMTI